MAINDISKVTLQSTFTGNDQIINTFHYKQTGALVGPDPAALQLAQLWITQVLPDYQGAISGRVLIESIEVIGQNVAEEAELTINDNGTLSPSDDVLPLQSAPVISWRTGVPGRSFRGRTYLPPPPETVQDAGNLNSTYVDLMSAFAEEAMVLVDGSDDPLFNLAIYSTVEDNAPRVPPIATVVTAYVIRTVVGGQNRRRQGRGS